MLTIVSAFVLVWVAPSSGSIVSADTSSTSSTSTTTTQPAACFVGCMNGSPATSSTTVPTTPCAAGSSTCLTMSQLPTRGVFWPRCTGTDQVYCTEPASLRDPSGNEVVTSASPYANCHNNDMTSTEKCSIDGSDWMEMGASIEGDTGSPRFSGVDITKYTYTWKVRTGKLEPSILMMGDTQKVVVGGNATDGWTIEISAKPSMRAYASPPCFTKETCATQVAQSVSTGLSGYLRMLGLNLNSAPSVDSEQTRAALRGTFISTNGMSQSWSFSKDTFMVQARSPHFLPPDSSGKSEVTPGFVRVFLPSSYITLDRGYSSVSMVTADRVQLTVSGANATAKVTPSSDGILVDTGVEHFSAPDPTIKILANNEKLGSSSPMTTTSTTNVNSTAPASSRSVASNVAPSTIKRGVPTALSRFATPQSSAKPKWSAKGSCKIVGKTVVATSSKGTCSLTLQTLNAKKKYVTTLRKTLKVS